MRLVRDTTAQRRFAARDLFAFLDYRNDPEVALYQSWEMTSAEAATAFIAEMNGVAPLLRPGEWTQVALADVQTDSLLGDMGWFLSLDSKELELGITLARAAQGQGHARRAISLTVEYARAETSVARCVAFADIRNTRSRALLHHAGFVHLGVETASDGCVEDVYEFKLFRPQV